MERERIEKESMNDMEKESLIYSFEIVKAALQNGWDIKIFQKDINLKYLYSILLDIDIDPNAVFSFSEFASKVDVKSAYDWAREVQRNMYEKYDLALGNSEELMERLDESYFDGINPWEVLSSKELVDIDIYCNDGIKGVSSLG